MRIAQKIKNLIADYRYLVIVVDNGLYESISQSMYDTIDKYFCDKYSDSKADIALDIICTTNINNSQVYRFLNQL